MVENTIIHLKGVPDNLTANIESRDVALWICGCPDKLEEEKLASFIGLPWRLVFSEIESQSVYSTLRSQESLHDPAVRKRGFVQIIDSDPSRIQLPQRCLPIYLLNGNKSVSSTDFESMLRRMTMLEILRRSGVRELLVISFGTNSVPSGLTELWAAGFRAFLSFISASEISDLSLEKWVANTDGIRAVNKIDGMPESIVEELLARYQQTYPSDRNIIRVRDRKGVLHKVDVTESDDPERPVLELYSLIEERDLSPIAPEELSKEDFVSFFKNPTVSWRPYAAGLPWKRGNVPEKQLNSLLSKLNSAGADENCIAYISSESGAGGTTLARMLAWELAKEGYPVLVAKPFSFTPDSLPLSNYLVRVHRAAEHQIAPINEIAHEHDEEPLGSRKKDVIVKRYETPFIIVFDSLHWQARDNELLRFRNELEKAGRPVCIIVITGPILGVAFYKTSIFKQIAQLNHALPQEEALELGRHLNKYLKTYGMQRQEYQWNQFYEEHTVQYVDGLSAFWVMLSFWIQGQYDLSESIQEWMYRKFKEIVTEPSLQHAVLEIAALSSVRLPLPEVLFPAAPGKWPVSHLLDDMRADLSGLGLMRMAVDGKKYWALVHDILGRFLINALFSDFSLREKLGFAEARDTEHLRFLLLRNISRKAALGEYAYQAIGEDFATSIFKIDPDHGFGSFAPFWREVLAALDEMPQALRDTSRVFRHHTSVSRRRITKLDEILYHVNQQDRLNLLHRAIDDINYALEYIDFTPNSESDVNLYNSLANAYLDLAKVESNDGASTERIAELRRLANAATRSAYSQNPTSPFVIETYAKNLLAEASVEANSNAIENCIEVLGIIFSALTSNEGIYRNSRLSDLADESLRILLGKTPTTKIYNEPSRPIDVLVRAWHILSQGAETSSVFNLSEIPIDYIKQALDSLSHPAGRGNIQVIRLSFDLLCTVSPYEFRGQLQLVEQLNATNYNISPQLQLEYAILLFFNSRATEGDKKFRSLRPVWRATENFVQVPARLRWLVTGDNHTLQTVHAVIASDNGNRAIARVKEFNNVEVLFRPEEFGIRDIRPRFPLTGHISFGHNGPFLRPVTALPSKTD